MRHIISSSLCAVFVCLLPLASLSAQSIAPVMEGVPLELEVLEDPTGTLSLSGARASTEWEPAKQSSPGFGFTQSAYWVRFKLRHPEGAGRPIAFYLQQQYPFIDLLQLYVPGAEDAYTVRELGDSFPFDQRPFKHRTFVFELQLDPGQSAQYYLRQKTTSGMNFQLSLWDPSSFDRRLKDELTVLWICYGMIFGVVAYNFLVFLSTRDPGYFYYVVSMISLALVLMSLSGLSYQHLWPTLVTWNNLSIIIVIHVTVFFAGGFFQNFLETRKLTPRVHYTWVVFQSLAVAGILLTIYSGLGGTIKPNLYRLSMIGALVVTMLAVLAATVMSLYLALKGRRAARLYFISWTSLFGGAFLTILNVFGVLAEYEWTRQGILVGTVAQAILLAMALADRINLYQRRTIELNENLERTVADRTAQLESLRRLATNGLRQARRARRASNQLETAIGALADASAKQAASAEQTSAAVTQMAASVANVTANVSQQGAGIRNAGDRMTSLSSALSDINNAMEGLSEIADTSRGEARDVSEAATALVAAMQRIREKAAQIDEIVTVIDDISDRTNLLSLNASIEAARAGEAGRGFAVVANEVSRLAERTADNTQNIQDLILDTRDEVEQGAEQVDRVTRFLNNILTSIQAIHGEAARVSGLVQAQDENSGSIAGQMNDVTRLTAEIEQSADEQKRTAAEISKAVEQFSENAAHIQSEVALLETAANHLTRIAAALEEDGERVGREAGFDTSDEEAEVVEESV